MTPGITNGRAVSGYQVEYRTQDIPWTDATPDTQSTATTWTHTGAPSAGAIKYRVSAINLVTTGPHSTEARTDAMAPTTPTGLTATPMGLDQIDLAWTMPDDGGAGLLGYRIEVSSDEGITWSDLVEDTGNLDTKYSHKGLQHTQTRHYRVSGINALGPGSPSDVAHTTTIRRLELPVLKDSETAVWESQITAGVDIYSNIGYGSGSFGSSTREGFNYSGIKYTAHSLFILAVTDGADRLILNFTNNEFSTWEDLFATPNFKLQVGMAEFEMSESQQDIRGYFWSPPGFNWGENEVTQVRLVRQKTSPIRPIGLTATTTSQGQIDLSWTAPEDNGGSAVTGYKVERSPDGDGNWTILERNTGDPDITYSDRGIPATTTRYYRVSAINALGTSRPSEIATGSTPPGDTLPPLRDNEAAIWESQIIVSQTMNSTGYVAGVSGSATVRQFTYSGKNYTAKTLSQTPVPNSPDLFVFRFEDEESDIKEDIFATPDFKLQAGMQEFILGDSDQGRIGYVWEDVDLGWADGDVITARLVRTKTAPEPPTGLTATTALQGGIDLSWTAPEDNGGSDITGYAIEMASDSDGTDRAFLKEDTGNSLTSYSHTGLPAGATRHYWVSAINETGASTRSGSAQGSASGTATGPVFQTATMGTNGQSIRMTFSKALDETSANAPPATAFTVKGNGTTQTISTLAISGTGVTLTLTSALAGGMRVTVSYADPTASDDTQAVQDTDGNDADSFTDQPANRERITLSVNTRSIPLGHTGPDGKTTFTVTRTGTTTNAVSVPVTFTQDQDWLASTRLSQTVMIAAGESTATLELTSRWFWEDNSDTLGSGDLTATLGGVTGYNASGQSQTIYIHGRAQETGITALDQTDYRLDEASGDNTFHLVSTLDPGVTPTPARRPLGTHRHQDRAGPGPPTLQPRQGPQGDIRHGDHLLGRRLPIGTGHVHSPQALHPDGLRRRLPRRRRVLPTGTARWGRSSPRGTSPMRRDHL